MLLSSTLFRYVECCRKCLVVMLLPPDPPLLFRQIATASDLVSKHYQSTIRAYNNFLAMGCVKADWVIRGHDSSSFNQKLTFDGRINHLYSPLLLACSQRPSFLSVYIHDTKCSKRGSAPGAQMPK